jgi:predicted nuclease of predicted toxin-antitoxin system
MLFVADESCDFRMVEALRGAGHDVRAVLEDSPGAPDLTIIDQARQEQRILMTEDRDFGRLVYADRLGRGAGVLYIRCRESARPGLPASIVALIDAHGSRLPGRFAVWTARRLRLRRTDGP